MHFEQNNLYHLYNRSNGGQLVYKTDANYEYFLNKVQKEWSFFDILAYCLMPTHFHFMVHVKLNVESNKINNSIGKLLSSYTRAINNENNSHGSIFQSHTKSKSLFQETSLNDHKLEPIGYPAYLFQYIHLNPIKDKLVINLEDWSHSSYLDYALLRSDSICNMKMAEKMLEFKRGEEFVELTKNQQNIIF